MRCYCAIFHRIVPVCCYNLCGCMVNRGSHQTTPGDAFKDFCSIRLHKASDGINQQRHTTRRHLAGGGGEHREKELRSRWSEWRCWRSAEKGDVAEVERDDDDDHDDDDDDDDDDENAWFYFMVRLDLGLRGVYWFELTVRNFRGLQGFWGIRLLYLCRVNSILLSITPSAQTWFLHTYAYYWVSLSYSSANPVNEARS